MLVILLACLVLSTVATNIAVKNNYKIRIIIEGYQFNLQDGFETYVTSSKYYNKHSTFTPSVLFYIFIQRIQVLNILNMVHTLRFFSSKCSLFHNSNIYCSCIIHIFIQCVLKLKKKHNSEARRLRQFWKILQKNDHSDLKRFCIFI